LGGFFFIRVVGTEPLLGSGKTDYVGATKLANEPATPANRKPFNRKSHNAIASPRDQ
jgi:hypothetical protein